MMQCLFKRSGLKLALLLTVMAILLFNASLILAQSGGGYSITRWTPGGSVAMAGGYTLTGYVNQSEPGPALQGSGYRLVGGYWSGTSIQSPVYLPVILRN